MVDPCNAKPTNDAYKHTKTHGHTHTHTLTLAHSLTHSLTHTFSHTHTHTHTLSLSLSFSLSFFLFLSLSLSLSLSLYLALSHTHTRANTPNTKHRNSNTERRNRHKETATVVPSAMLRVCLASGAELTSLAVEERLLTAIFNLGVPGSGLWRFEGLRQQHCDRQFCLSLHYATMEPRYIIPSIYRAAKAQRRLRILQDMDFAMPKILGLRIGL